MKRRHYIFTNKRHTKKAIMSTMLGLISTASLGAVIYFTYATGEAKIGYGFTGFLAAIFSLIGLGLGIVSIRDKDNYRIFPWLGMIFNLTALSGIALILYMGIR